MGLGAWGMGLGAVRATVLRLVALVVDEACAAEGVGHRAVRRGGRGGREVAGIALRPALGSPTPAVIGVAGAGTPAVSPGSRGAAPAVTARARSAAPAVTARARGGAPAVVAGTAGAASPAAPARPRGGAGAAGVSGSRSGCSWSFAAGGPAGARARRAV